MTVRETLCLTSGEVYCSLISNYVLLRTTCVRVRVEKMEEAHTFSSSHGSTLQELDSIVRDIIGAEIFDAHTANYNTNKDQQLKSSKPVAKIARAQPTKKTRQHSPSRKAPFNALDQLFHHQ